MRGKRLRAARIRAQFSVKEAANRVSKSVSTLKSWESSRGHDPRLSDAERICSLYNITMDWYVSGKEPMYRSGGTTQYITNVLHRLPNDSQMALLQFVESLTTNKNSPARRGDSV
jgi:transcriptional regulator with XRE-family HTH domain